MVPKFELETTCMSAVPGKSGIIRTESARGNRYHWDVTEDRIISGNWLNGTFLMRRQQPLELKHIQVQRV